MRMCSGAASGKKLVEFAGFEAGGLWLNFGVWEFEKSWSACTIKHRHEQRSNNGAKPTQTTRRIDAVRGRKRAAGEMKHANALQERRENDGRIEWRETDRTRGCTVRGDRSEQREPK
jgi:hypothetical protein